MKLSAPHSGAAPSDDAAVAALRGLGYPVTTVESIASDQTPFAVPVRPRMRTLAPGFHLDSTSVNLGDGAFTNVHTLRVDLERASVEAVSDPGGFHLRDLLRDGRALAAVSGSFSFISDDTAYQPAEPCLDLCYRHGQAASLPTASKPALLQQQGRPALGHVDARGSLRLAGRPYRWAGSKTAAATERRPGQLTVFGAANCEVLYRPHPRTGFVRYVDAASNLTPACPAAVDYVIDADPQGDLRVISIHAGGRADLFAGRFILRDTSPASAQAPLGALVEITEIAGRTTQGLVCGFSLGPSVEDAAAGRTPAYDASLGTSPFQDARHARTLIAIRGNELILKILDGAPRADRFRGATPRETAAICAAEDLDPHTVFHLDGGASSKVAFLEQGTPAVLGSMHYLRWPAGPAEPFRWQGLEGRILRSAVALVPSQARSSR